MADENQEKKIIVDDDWKAQARAEKEKLAAEQKAKAAEKSAESPAGADPSAAGAHGQELPPASFTSLINTLASQALFALGAVPDPMTQKRYVDLDLAKFHIDMLKVVEEKTTGNLTEEEKQMLNTTSYELRSSYIAIARQVSEQQMGAQGPAAGMGG